MKLKILQISPQVPVPPIDGGKISIFGLLKSLSERGHEIDFFCYRKHSDYNFSYNELSKYSKPRIIDVQTDNNFLKAFLNIFNDLPYNVSKYINEKILKAISDYFKENDPDVIHIDHIHMAWLVDYLRNMTSKPIILREHNFESDILYRMYLNKTFPLFKYYFFEQYKRLMRYETQFAEKFDKVVMISEADESKILKVNNKIKTIVIPAGVDHNLIQKNAYQVSKIPFSIFHVGTLDWEPNLDGLLWFINEIFPFVIKKFPKSMLFIYGKNSEQIKIPNYLKNNIALMGFVPDLWREISNKQIGIVPLRVGSGIRIKILELLAQGHLIISTDIGKEGIPIIDGIHYLNANNSEEFINKIFEVFDHAYDIMTICSNAQNFIKSNFLWETIAERFENLYKSLIFN